MRLFKKNIIAFVLFAVLPQLSAQTLHNPTIHSSGFYGNEGAFETAGGVGAIGADLYGSDEMRLYQSQFGPTNNLNYNHTDRLRYCISYDYNQDGLDDLVGISDSFGGLIWYENLGNGEFDEPVFIRGLKKTNLNSFTIEEMEDGNLYVVFVSFSEHESKSISRTLITEDPNLQEIEFIAANVYHHEWYDVNGDGRLDLIYNSFVEDVSNQIYFKLNLPNSFSSEYILAHIDGLLAFSLSQWSWSDQGAATNRIVYAADEPSRIGSLSFNQSAGTFVRDHEMELEEFDFGFNGINSADPLIATQYETATDAYQCFVFMNGFVYRFDKNEATMTQHFQVILPVSQFLKIKGIIDLNDDGVLDLVLARTSGTVDYNQFLFSNLNDGEVEYSLATSSTSNTSFVLNGRGLLHQFNPEEAPRFINYLYDLEGELEFELDDDEWEAKLIKYNGFSHYSSLKTADVNGDGVDELLCKHSSVSGTYDLLIRNELGRYITQELSIYADHDEFELFDLNADNLLDLVFYEEEGLLYRENLGDFSFAEEMTTFYSDAESIVVDAQQVDFNGDSIDDVIVATTDKVVLMKGLGSSYQEETLLDGQNSIVQILAADLNKDGVQDLVLNKGVDLLILMYNAEGSVFTASVIPYGSPKRLVGHINQSENDYPLLLLRSLSFSSQDLFYLKNEEGIIGDLAGITTMAKGDSPNIVDYNGDGKDELIYVTAANDLQRVIFVGNAHYDTPIDSDLDFSILRFSQSLKVNEDDRPDLVFLNESSINRLIQYKENMPDKPKAEIGLPSGNCLDQRFINLSAAYFPESTVLWDFGDGNTSTEIHPQHDYEELGVYEIQLTVCNDIGCDTANAQFEKVSNIALDIPESASVNEVVTFLNNSEGISDASWFFGDGEFSLDLEPSYAYSVARPYTFEVFLTNDEVTDCTFFLAQDINILGEGTGITELSCQPKVFPNPSSGIIQIANCAEEVSGIQFMNVSGQIMRRFEDIGSTFDLDLRGMNSGMYLLQWLDDKGSVLGAHRVVLK